MRARTFIMVSLSFSFLVTQKRLKEQAAVKPGTGATKTVTMRSGFGADRARVMTRFEARGLSALLEGLK